MFCQQCGKQLDDTARFCGGCGVSTVGNSSGAQTAAGGTLAAASANAVERLGSQLRVLGILWAVYSGFRMLMAAWTVVFTRAMLPAFAEMVPHDADINIAPFLKAMSGFYIVSGVWAVVAGIVGIWAAWALLKRQRSGRTIALVIAFVSLISIPFGTALGVYTLVVLLPQTAGHTYEQITATT
jgi:hypothetical protein